MISPVSNIYGVKYGNGAEETNGVVYSLMRSVRTIITIILCIYECMRHVIMLHMKVTHCMWCRFPEL